MTQMSLTQWFVRLVFLMLFGMLSGGPTLAAVVDAAEPPQLLVPAYFYPAGEGLKSWERLIASGRRLTERNGRLTVIANPASGPGKRVDPQYTKVLSDAVKQARVIGYISTNYAQRPVRDVEQEMDRWLKFYPGISGFFFDEQASGAEQVAYYASLSRYARSKIKGAFLVTNPGTLCDEAYFKQDVADTICVVERGVSLEEYQPPTWVTRYGASRFYGLAYGVKDQDALERSTAAVPAKHLGYFYVTDDELPNPWDTLPLYWDDEVTATVPLDR